MPADAKQRMIESAAMLVRERGVEGTSFSDVLAASGAPRGSIYHHFPGGKSQLMEEATGYAGGVIAERLGQSLAGDDPIAGLHRFAAGWISVLRKSNYLAGCPVVAAAVEGDTHPAARGAAAAAFAEWEQTLADCLVRRGLPRSRGRSLATLVIAALEGAIVLSRAKKSTAPLRRVESQLERVIASALEA